MGMVYLAQQEQPFRRRVALKIIKLGMDTREVIARFESERQALALMNHPHIAKVFDAGTTEQGRPYFVMEHVAGIPITKYCDKNRLTIPERLQLFTQVCQAIHHAHQKGIIHRDIKASNVLVAVEEGKPVPKVIDFGVAKATNQRLTDKTLYTQLGSSIGTPEYMSPEQAESSGLDVDKTTDIYSLGVLLYELLVGVFPFNLLMTRFDAMLRTIRDKEPPKLITRLSSLGEKASKIAEQRNTDIRSLSRKLRGELDWITQKAMEKDRTRRYQAASELAADIGRYLKNEPVLAGPPSVAYRLRKFIVRHRAALAPVAWGGVVAALVVLLVGLNVGGVRERLFGAGIPKIESLAVLPFDNLMGDPEQQYFFVDGMMAELITNLSKIKALKVISQTSAMRYKDTDKTIPEIARELKVDVVVEGSVLRVGERVRITAQLIHGATDTHLWAESYERDLQDVFILQSEVALAIAKEIQIAVTSEEEEQLTRIRPVNLEARELYLRGRYHWSKRTGEDTRKAIKLFEQAVEKDPDYAAPYLGLAESYSILSNYTEMPHGESARNAKFWAEKALEIDESLAGAYAVLANEREVSHDWKEAGAHFKRAIELNPDYATAHHWYALHLNLTARHEEAVAEIKRAHELDPASVVINHNVGYIFYTARRYDDAIEACLRAIELEPKFSATHSTLGLAYLEKGRNEAAISELEKATVLCSEATGMISNLGYAYARLGRREKAKELIKELQSRAATSHGLSSTIAMIHVGLGNWEQALGQLEYGFLHGEAGLKRINSDPRYDPLRDESRFQDLLRRMNFPEEVPR